MRIRLALAAVLAVGLTVGTAAQAAPPKKTITKSYTATASPDPTPITGQTGGNCSPTLDSAKHETPFAIPYAGVITVKVHKFQGDWALALLDADGAVIVAHDNDITEPIDTPSEITMKFKKKGTITVRACNFLGGPTATVDIKLVPTK